MVLDQQYSGGVAKSGANGWKTEVLLNAKDLLDPSRQKICSFNLWIS